MNFFKRLFQPMGFNLNAHELAKDETKTLQERCIGLAMIGKGMPQKNPRAAYYYESWVKDRLIKEMGWGAEGVTTFQLLSAAIMHNMPAFIEVNHEGKKTMVVDTTRIGEGGIVTGVQVSSKPDGTKVYSLK